MQINLLADNLYTSVEHVARQQVKVKGKMMTVANAVKKLTKAGFEVTSSKLGYAGRKGNQVIEFNRISTDSDTIFGVKVRSANDNDSAISDYSAGVWCDNISQAIRLASC